MTKRREHWFEDASGPLVRPYAISQGRTGGHHSLDMITLIVTAGFGGVDGLEPESRRILGMCRRPTSIAEVAAQLELPLTVTKILINDLIVAGYLIYRSPDSSRSSGSTDIDLLRTVLNGIRKL
ncbi:DUF742 domain-containing protein [Nocardia sp. NPDC051929]|uniref:DUF742 domain-containing protein n=1 Tax=unclassified Nocardia TaxID=2637762 RepID=UPI003423FEBE